jgi:hypothetical protein
MQLGLEPADLRALLLSVGSRSGRRPLAPIEVAALLDGAMKRGASPKNLAAALHLEGPTMISRFVRLLSLAPEVQLVTDWGKTAATIAFTTASEISRLESIDEQAEACHGALRHGLTSGEVKSLVQIRKRSGKPLVECLEEVIRLRPTIELRQVVVGAVTDESVRERLRSMGQYSRDDVLSKAIKSAFPEIREFAGKLGADRFTVAGAQAALAPLLAHQGVEDQVTTAIKSELGKLELTNG